jgi:Na+-driven multidrug efflux pump
MQIANKSKTPEIMTFIVTLGFFGVLFYILIYDAKPGEVMLIMLGQLGTAWAAIVGFWFGSTAGSSRKTELLSQAPAIGQK